MTAFTQWVLAVVVLTGTAIAFAWKWPRSDKAPAARLPQQVAVHPRPVLNRIDRQVWHWLQLVFPEHHIMVKLPVTRFTSPKDREGAEIWFPKLNRVYCTFALCDEQGRVVACIDVMGLQPLSRSNRQLKRTLFAHCQISYGIVNPEAMPTAEEIRAELLGLDATEVDSGPRTEISQLQTARDHLQEVLDRNRHHRGSAQPPSHVAISNWGQLDSALNSLDSGRTSLNTERDALRAS